MITLRRAFAVSFIWIGMMVFFAITPPQAHGALHRPVAFSAAMDLRTPQTARASLVRGYTRYLTAQALEAAQDRRQAAQAAARKAALAAAQAPPVTTVPVTTAASGPFGMPSAAFTSCVISRESGGDPTAYNTSSTASGLFGMEIAFWDAYGDARDYPNGAYSAPASAQYAAFYAGYAAQGTAPWAPYDGC